MKKLSLFVAMLCMSVVMMADDEVNFALASNGSSATASSGDAALAIDGNQGTRWESAQTDDEWFLLDLGQSRTFNYFKILWEGAYAKEFKLLASTDGETFNAIYTETSLAQSGWQKIYLETPVTGRYIKYQGIKRATGYGQSFFEFEVYYLSEAPKTYTQIEGLSIVASSGGNNDVNRVLDGNAGSEWQGRPDSISGGDEASRTFDAWFVVDLGGVCNVDKVDIHFEGACAQDYHIDFSLDNTTWALGYDFVGNPGINGRTDEVTKLDNNIKVRYVRFWSTKAATEWGMKIFEFRVYGEPWVPTEDSQAPVMVSASLVENNYNSAVIEVSATDDNEVMKYRVVDSSKEYDAQFVATDGKITVIGLTPSTTYSLKVYAIDIVGKESQNFKTVAVTTDNYISEPSAAATAPTWPAAQVKAIYSPTYNANCGFGEWGSGTTVTDTEFGKKYVTVGGGYFGMVDFAINALLMEKLHYDIWIADNTTIRIVPIWGGAEQGVTVTLKGQQWNSVDIALEQYTGITDWSNIYQIKIDQASNLTLWIGNAYFYRTTAIEDNDAPTNVNGKMASAGYFNAVLALSADDNLGVVNFVVMNGDKEVATGAGKAGDTIKVNVQNLLPNTDYNFSVIAKDDKGNSADAIDVAAKTLTAPAPVPKPDLTDKVIVPVFTDAVAGGPAISIGGWGQSTIVINGQLAEGDNVQYFSNMNYLGWELTPAVNATDMKYLHVDLFSTTMSSIKVTPISPGHEGEAAVELTSGKWTHADIDLSVYAINEIDWSNVFQFKFMNATPAGGDLFVDNVYFYGDSAQTAIENVPEEKVQCTKMIKNGQLYIMYKGTKYNVQGIRVE
ncbi:MAG: discoidin domain-containing protein [Paludibacteraceae bacterium]|nr:discoidin domain-containing protein [Paludibacteraceae bacterium]